MDVQINNLIHVAVQNFQQGDLAEAEALLKKVLQAEPEHFGALHIMGVICAFQNKPADAIAFFRHAVEINPGNRLANYNLAKVLSESGADLEALPFHDKAVELNPNDQDAWVNYGKCLFNLGRFEEALDCYRKALDIKPELAEALINKGATLARLQRNEDAMSCLDKALAINPSLAEPWSNSAEILCGLKRYDEALFRYDRAIELSPDNVGLQISKGDAYSSSRRYEEALAQYDRAIRLAPNHADAWFKKGNILNELKRHDDALAHYDRAIQLKPDRDFIHGNRLTTKMSVCDWGGIDELLVELAGRINSGSRAAAPFEVLCYYDLPALHKKTAELYAPIFAPDHSLGSISKHLVRDKIRVAYFSSDFRNHATAYLTAGLFEHHDKSRFEITAFSYGPEQSDRMRGRLVPSFDRFIDVNGKSDRDVVRLARELEIDIAVDLQGYQTEHRPGIFACRAAPIQVNYLAYPGTMGAEYMDYIVADKTLVSPGSQQYYAEKIAYLPGSYQANDRHRVISDRPFTRKELGLPHDGFVFCCFNGLHKIMPKTFDSWMTMLRAVAGSALWLFDGAQAAKDNLRQEALRRGVAPERLIFASYMDLPEHLARHRLADLFLDTLPYNAHTTASDALWAGLPVLTCVGESFPGRVAASLLNAMNMPELITHSQEEFVRLAIELACNPERLADIRRKLADNRLSTPLFDTPQYTRHLEAAYTAMYERYQAGLSPDHIQIA